MIVGFSFGVMVGILVAAAASRVAGPAPDYVFIVGGAFLLGNGALLLGAWLGRYR